MRGSGHDLQRVKHFEWEFQVVCNCHEACINHLYNFAGEVLNLLAMEGSSNDYPYCNSVCQNQLLTDL